MTNTTPTLQLVDGCLLVSGSMKSAIQRCPTYASYRYIHQRQRTGGIAKGRDPGKAFHKAIEALYQHSADGVLTDAALVAAHDALAQAYAGFELVEGDEHLSLTRVAQTLDAYVSGCHIILGKDGKNGIYKHPGYQREPFRVLGTETAFAVRLGEVRLREVGLGAFYCGEHDGITKYEMAPVIYLGYIDLLTQWHERGEVIVMDTKTMRKWDASKIVEWRMAGAPKGYAYCLPRYLREGIEQLPPTIREAMQPYEEKRKALAALAIERVDGFCLNAVVQRASTDLTRCKNAPTEFHRELYYYSDQHLEEWRADMLRWCQAWVEWSSRGEWPMTDSSCANYFGRICPYQEVCSLPPEQRALMLSTDMFEDAKRGYVKQREEAEVEAV